MSLDLVNAIATSGTCLVIAATAIAAVVQLRNARTSNQIAAFNELRESQQKPEFQAAEQFVKIQLHEKLRDPAFRYQVANRSARTDEHALLVANITIVGNFYEDMGALLITGLIDNDLVLRLYGGRVTRAWEQLAPVAAIYRRRNGGSLIWENFEVLTVLAQAWAAAHPKGVYPAGLRRILIHDEWLEADRQYVASLVTA